MERRKEKQEETVKRKERGKISFCLIKTHFHTTFALFGNCECGNTLWRVALWGRAAKESRCRDLKIDLIRKLYLHEKARPERTPPFSANASFSGWFRGSPT